VTRNPAWYPRASMLLDRRRLLLSGAAALAGAAWPRLARGDAPGRYHLDVQDGVWWLVDPDGKPTVSLGVNHVDPESLLHPWNRHATKARYGHDFVRHGRFDPDGAAAGRWADHLVAELADLGFDTLGFHDQAPDAVHEHVAFFAHVRPVSITPYARPEYADVFDPAVARRIDDGARAVCEAVRDHPRLLGYVYDDRPVYGLGVTDLRRADVHPWVVALRSLDAAAPGKQAADAQPDDAALLATIIERWYQLHFDAIRRYDPDHLIFGDKLGGGRAPRGGDAAFHPNIPPLMYPTLAKYVDVVTIEWYGYFADQLPVLQAIHAATGKPILLGDSSFVVASPDRPDGTRGVMVDSYAAMGDAYAAYLQDALRQPFIVGWHFCGWVEGRGTRADNGGALPTGGFQDGFEAVHEDVVDRVRAANAMAVAWHAAAGGS
jgi:hypothetical protein